jgi:hypothetical protein
MLAISKIYSTKTKLHAEIKLTPKKNEFYRVLWYTSRVQCELCMHQGDTLFFARYFSAFPSKNCKQHSVLSTQSGITHTQPLKKP